MTTAKIPFQNTFPFWKMEFWLGFLFGSDWNLGKQDPDEK